MIRLIIFACTIIMIITKCSLILVNALKLSFSSNVFEKARKSLLDQIRFPLFFQTENVSSLLQRLYDRHVAIDSLISFIILPSLLFDPHHKKTGLWGFRPGPTQTGLYNHRRWLE